MALWSKIRGTIETGFQFGLSGPIWMANSGTLEAKNSGGSAFTSVSGLFRPPAGTAVAGTSPLKFTSGPLLTAAESGALEFLTDDYYATITTGAARKPLVMADAALTAGRIPFTTTNGRLADSANLTRNATTGEIGLTYNVAGQAAAIKLTNTVVSTYAASFLQCVSDGGSVYFGADSTNSATFAGGGYVYVGGARPLGFYTNATKRLELSGAGLLTSSATGNVFNNYGVFGVASRGANTLLAVGNSVGSFTGAAAMHVTDNSVNATVNYQNVNAAGYTAFDFYNSSNVKSATFAWSNASAGFPNTLWISTRTATDFWFGTNTTERLRILAGGNIGVGVTVPTAAFHIKAGTATVGTAPLKMTAGPVNTLPEAGAMEFDGNAYYLTVGTTRRRVSFVTVPTTVIAGPYTVLDTDETLLVQCTTLAITVNLPSAIQSGRKLTVKKIDSTALNVTVDASGAQTIDGDLTQVLVTRNASITMIADGANWWIV